MINATMLRLVVLLLVGTLVTVLASFVLVYRKTHREYETLEARERIYQERVAEIREEIRVKDHYLNTMLEDPEFLGRVVRKRLGYAGRDELVFRFDDGLAGGY